MRIGGIDYDAEHVLTHLYMLMKRYPDLVAQEIMWSYFIPNDLALAEAQRNGKPKTLGDIMEDFKRWGDVEDVSPDSEPSHKKGVYRLWVLDKTKHGHHRPHHIVVLANSAQQARKIAADESRRFESPKSYDKDKIWLSAKTAGVALICGFSPSSTGRSRYSPRVLCASNPIEYKRMKYIERAICRSVIEEIAKKLDMNVDELRMRLGEKEGSSTSEEETP